MSLTAPRSSKLRLRQLPLFVSLRRCCLKYWKHTLTGFAFPIPFCVFLFYFIDLMHNIFHRVFMPSSVIILGVITACITWGTVQAIFVLITGIVAVFIYYKLNVGENILFSEDRDIAQIIPLLVVAFIVLVIVRQRDIAYINMRNYARELEVRNREKDSFLSIASHELRTPLTIIQSQSQLLHRRLKKNRAIDNETLIKDFELINEQTHVLSNLVNEFVDIGSIEHDQIQMHKDNYDLNFLCKKVVDSEKLITAHPIRYSPADIPLPVLVDVDRMMRAILNLISNAIKYSPETLPIDVVLEKNSQYARLEIRDYGNGMTEEEVTHIFDIYYRAPEVHSSAISGLGLGLTISKEIVERNNGRIWCESFLGEGTSFFVELPLN